MRRALLICVTTAFVVIGCTTRPVPTSPSSERSALGASSSAGASAGAGQTIAWSCMATDAAARGIFSSAGAACRSAELWRVLESHGASVSAPAPPVGLSSAINGTTVTLTWSAPSGSDPATSYIVEAGSAPGLINLATFDTGSASPSLTATGVPPGTYYVRVRSKNAAGVSTPSNETVVAVGGSCGTVPGPPTNLNTSSSGSSVALTWTGPSGGCPPSAYFIEAGSSPGQNNLADFSTGNAGTLFTADGVGNGTYYVRVRSWTTAGKSTPSNEATLVVGSPQTCVTGAPTGVVVSVNGNTVTVTWNAAGGSPSAYVIEVGRSSGASDYAVSDTGSTATTLSATLPNGTYYIRIKARYSCGTGPASNEAIAAVGGTPSSLPHADFVVIPDGGTSVTLNPGQCLINAAPPSILLKCTFDGSSSTGSPAITTYQWSIPAYGLTFNGQSVPDPKLGSCGITPGAGTKDVTLTVTSPAGSSSTTKPITFIKGTYC